MFGQQAGFDGIELVILPQHIFKTRQIKELAEKHQQPVLSIHQPPWHWPHTTKGMLRRLAKFAQGVGAKNIVVHLTVLRFHLQKNIFSFISSLEEQYGLTFSLENSCPSGGEWPPNWAWQEDELRKLVRQYNINLTLDDPKFTLSGYSSTRFFEEQKDKIKNIHIHGIHRKKIHYPISGSDYNSTPFLKKVKELRYQQTLVLEVFPLKKLSSRLTLGEVGEIIKKDTELVRKNII